MTWKTLDDIVDGELRELYERSSESSYVDWSEIENEDINEAGACHALEVAFEYVKASMEYADDPAAMKDLTRTAETIQKAAGRTKGAYYWPFVLTIA